ncbi:hypothetical protein M8J77_008270 [Diaphorina citri]|nr:hypothetical protein M8J77_008270 [Diaphorina citri]
MRLILGGCFVFMLNSVIIHVQAENELELNPGPLIKTFNKASTIGEPINLPYAKEDLEKAGNQESLEKYPVKTNSADLKEDNNLDSNTEQSTDIPADESVKNQLSNTLMKDPEAIVNSRQDTEKGVPTQINDDIKEEIIKQYLLKEIHNPVIPTDDIKHDEKQKVLRHLLSNVLSNAEDVNQMPTKVEDMDKIKKTQESDNENPDEVNSNQFISKDMKNVESVTKQTNMLDESVKVSDILNNSEKDNNDLIKASMKKMNGEAKDNIRYLLDKDYKFQNSQEDVNLKPELPELVKKFQTLGSDSGKLLNQEHSTQSDQTENNHPSEDNRKENDTKIFAGNDTTPVENNKKDVPSTSDTIPTVESSTAVGDTTDTPNSETKQAVNDSDNKRSKDNDSPIRQVTPAETSGVENGDSTTESPKDIDNPSLQVGSGFDSNGNKEDDRKIVDQRSQTGPSSDLENKAPTKPKAPTMIAVPNNLNNASLPLDELSGQNSSTLSTNLSDMNIDQIRSLSDQDILEKLEETQKMDTDVLNRINSDPEVMREYLATPQHVPNIDPLPVDVAAKNVGKSGDANTTERNNHLQTPVVNLLANNPFQNQVVTDSSLIDPKTLKSMSDAALQVSLISLLASMNPAQINQINIQPTGYGTFQTYIGDIDLNIELVPVQSSPLTRKKAKDMFKDVSKAVNNIHAKMPPGTDEVIKAVISATVPGGSEMIAVGEVIAQVVKKQKEAQKHNRSNNQSDDSN